MISGFAASFAHIFRHLPTWRAGSMEDCLQLPAEAAAHDAWAHWMNKILGWRQEQKSAKAGKVS
jgi:hypothetical protein